MATDQNLILAQSNSLRLTKLYIDTIQYINFMLEIHCGRHWGQFKISPLMKRRKK